LPIVLEPQCADGSLFLSTAQQWLDATAPQLQPGVLHYVAVCAKADWASVAAPPAEPTPLAAEFYTACANTLPGVQRLLLAGGKISLTLCVGPLKAMLLAQTFEADAVHLPLTDVGTNDPWDTWTIQALTRLCRRGTRLHWHGASAGLGQRFIPQEFIQQGFESGPDAAYNPRWQLRKTRSGKNFHTPLSPQRCAVVGAGLAGASVARAMAMRGWQVTVLDALVQPAGGASGLPVGVIAPPTSADDNPRSRLSRTGVQLTLNHARNLLPHAQDWMATGVQELTTDADTWHAHAGWIKPASLVQAWLVHPGIRCVLNAPVAALQRTESTWNLNTASGQTLAQAELVIVANALGAGSLLQRLPTPWTPSLAVLHQLQSLQALHGLVSHGAMPEVEAGTDLFPRHPVNGHGSLVAHVPSAQGPQWFIGAAYAAQAATSAPEIAAAHAANWQRLHQLLPAAADALTSQFVPQLQGHPVAHWAGVRCASRDMLPLVGPLDTQGASGVWLSIAMGSRGLSFAALCAELLAAWIGAEPLPVDKRLAQSLSLHHTRRSLAAH
jgi:tRNA 5-methylaminomethyl-2-thiouridine biosynthesis bifunctional protein